MELLARLKTGLVLTKDSLLVIRHHPRLALFPLVSVLAAGAFLAVFLGITFGLAAVAADAGMLAGLFLVYLALTFVSTFFTAGLVHQTRSALAGNEVSIKSGLTAAWERKTPILIWSIVAATVSVLINAIENSNSTLSRLLGTLFGVAWTLLTFFVVPVIMFERTSAVEMFTRSGETFKTTFGETPISLVAIQILSIALTIPIYLVAYGLYAAGLLVPAVAVFLLGTLVGFLVSQTISGVVKTTLYLYAETGSKPAEFDDVDFNRLNTDGASRAPRTGGRH